MRSGGLELTRLTYSRHEDNLLHPRGDRRWFVLMVLVLVLVLVMVMVMAVFDVGGVGDEYGGVGVGVGGVGVDGGSDMWGGGSVVVVLVIVDVVRTVVFVLLCLVGTMFVPVKKKKLPGAVSLFEVHPRFW